MMRSFLIFLFDGVVFLFGTAIRLSCKSACLQKNEIKTMLFLKTTFLLQNQILNLKNHLFLMFQNKEYFPSRNLRIF